MEPSIKTPIIALIIETTCVVVFCLPKQGNKNNLIMIIPSSKI